MLRRSIKMCRTQKTRKMGYSPLQGAARGRKPQRQQVFQHGAMPAMVTAAQAGSFSNSERKQL